MSIIRSASTEHHTFFRFLLSLFKLIIELSEENTWFFRSSLLFIVFLYDYWGLFQNRLSPFLCRFAIFFNLHDLVWFKSEIFAKLFIYVNFSTTEYVKLTPLFGFISWLFFSTAYILFLGLAIGCFLFGVTFDKFTIDWASSQAIEFWSSSFSFWSLICIDIEWWSLQAWLSSIMLLFNC